MRYLLTLLSFCFCVVVPSLAQTEGKNYTIGSGGASMYDIPLRQLTKEDQAKLYDTGGPRTGLVKGGKVRLIQTQTYVYGRTSYEGTAYTSGGAAQAYNKKSYRYQAGYIQVVDAPAQPHVKGKKGWIVLKKEYLRTRGDQKEWVIQDEANLDTTLPGASYPTRK